MSFLLILLYTYKVFLGLNEKDIQCLTSLIFGLSQGRKEGNVLFNDAHNTFYLRLYGIRHMVMDHSDSNHMGYSFQLTARVLLYASSHRQDSTYHSLCYTSNGALAGMRNSLSQGPLLDITVSV